MVNMLPFIHNCQFCGFLLNNNNCIDRLSTLEWKANIQNRYLCHHSTTGVKTPDVIWLYAFPYSPQTEKYLVEIDALPKL